MKRLLIGAIWLYRRLPDRFKRNCLFKESCSSLVARVAFESGLRAGLKAMKTRVSQCRPGYTVYFNHPIREWQVSLADGSIPEGSAIADFVVAPYRENSKFRQEFHFHYKVN